MKIPSSYKMKHSIWQQAANSSNDTCCLFLICCWGLHWNGDGLRNSEVYIFVHIPSMFLWIVLIWLDQCRILWIWLWSIGHNQHAFCDMPQNSCCGSEVVFSKDARLDQWLKKTTAWKVFGNFVSSKWQVCAFKMVAVDFTYADYLMCHYFTWQVAECCIQEIHFCLFVCVINRLLQTRQWSW